MLSFKKGPIIFSLFTLCLIGTLSIIVNIDYSISIPVEQNCASYSNFDLGKHLAKKDLTDILLTFPFSTYLDSANICNIRNLEQDIAVLDSLNPNFPEKNREVIFSALTEKLANRVRPSINNYHLDSLILLFQWANRFNYPQSVDQANEYVYQITYDHWMNLIANQLGTYYDHRPSIKYDFKFKYLHSNCMAKRYAPPTGNTDFEKVIIYLSESKFGYLFNRFWRGTNWLFKTIFFTGISLGIYCVFFTIKSFFTNT